MGSNPKPHSIFSLLRSALTVTAMTLATGAVQAGAQDAAACEGDEFHAFDYWIGEWVVRDVEGTEVGQNTISRRSAGCMLLEQWRSADGPEGSSINYYDRTEGKWHQDWIGGGGEILHLSGGLVDGVMTLQGPRETPRGKIVDRIQWVPLDDGRVEQRWETSRDGEENWRLVFQGFYERAEG